ncbi:putative membrane protein [Blastococcus colisei]|uniref:Putative membrane protein n=1 Tax=Blastococcus colisei TaxID=1564162 RepID=A0A543PGM3_9ACTN|nr:DUF998 domain-containing protein [Blastococcus colisei]TQN43232.1 putative membrane protein [Blastococcus colisei]
MDGVNRNRLRWGAIAWLLTLQFFVLETLAQRRFEGSYSRVDDVISALGASDSAGRELMNASFVVQAALILAGALLLRPALLRGAAQAVPYLLGAASLGVLLVGVFPTDGNSTLHAVGAVLYFVGGGLGLVALAYAVRPRSEALGTTLALLGLIATAATAFFLTGVTSYLGEGSTERVAAYPLPLGLALVAAALWRLGPLDAGAAPEEAARPGRREERAHARGERAARARERDEALEASARRKSETRPDDAEELEDPWAGSSRRE